MNKRKKTPMLYFPFPPPLPAIISRKRLREEPAGTKTGTDVIRRNLGFSESRREDHHVLHCDIDPSAAPPVMGPPRLMAHDRKPEQEEILRTKEGNDCHEVEKGRRKGNHFTPFNRNNNFTSSGLETSIRVHLRSNENERCGEEEEERQQLHYPQYDEKEEKDKYEDVEKEEEEENKCGDDEKANEKKDDKTLISSPGISDERWFNGEGSLPYIKRKSIYLNQFHLMDEEEKEDKNLSRLECEKDAAAITSSSIYIIADLNKFEEEEVEEEEAASAAASSVALIKSPNAAERWPESALYKEGKEEGRGDTITTTTSTSEKSNGAESNPGSENTTAFHDMLLSNAAMELGVVFPTSLQQSSSAEDDFERKVAEEDREDLYSIVKRRRSHAATMPGTCNRINGKGWRCGWPTPPGYSLCERHCVGRRSWRRSYGDTRDTQSMYTSKKTEEKDVAVKEDDASADDDKGEMPRVMKKKRSKRRKVKTRSIASLLAETQPVNIKYK